MQLYSLKNPLTPCIPTNGNFSNPLPKYLLLLYFQMKWSKLLMDLLLYLNFVTLSVQKQCINFINSNICSNYWPPGTICLEEIKISAKQRTEDQRGKDAHLNSAQKSQSSFRNILIAEYSFVSLLLMKSCQRYAMKIWLANICSFVLCHFCVEKWETVG